MMQSLTGSVRERLPHQFKLADLFLVLSAVPVLVIFTLAPETLWLSWAGFGKLGRGGLLFVLFFLGFELMDFRKIAKPHLNRSRKISIVFLVGFALFYFGAIAVVGQFTDSVYWVGRVLGASGENSNSFLMAVDYVTMTLYVVGLATAFFGPRSILNIITAVVFSAGMLMMYLLDAFFPYGSLGPLQFWANFIVAGVALLSKGFGLPIYGFGNSLTILGKHGTYRLYVFWPSVGVQSMLIYSLVMILLAAKLVAPAKRKIAYAVAGVAGTIFLNVTRIFLIAYYGYMYATSGGDLDAFHNSIGEFLFPVWIIAFLVIVLNIEGRLSAGPKHATLQELDAPETTLGHKEPSPPAMVNLLDRVG
jgi:thaumarchaeosortase